MVKSDEALDAMIAIVRASAFEDTRRSAALKIVTHPNALKGLGAARRVEDLTVVALAARLDSAAETIAEIIGEWVDEIAAKGPKSALRLLAKHHPHPGIREKASGALK
jgi:hypothetical protein